MIGGKTKKEEKPFIIYAKKSESKILYCKGFWYGTMRVGGGKKIMIEIFCWQYVGMVPMD